jgi:SAM-dependent methyltransferase/enamine deaminase RidA (YjgF/YER057c/UK114 family)
MSPGDDGDDLKRQAQARFGRSADRYVESSILAEGEELARMVELAELSGTELALDVATGGGHTALAFAPHVREVVASDLTPAMLEAARQHVARRGVNNVRFELADAEALPYTDGEFDVLTARFAPHHFPEPAAFVAEAARVLKPGGRLVLFDNMVPEDDDLDAFMNRFEAWRDPSHVRAHRSSEWQRMLRTAGFTAVIADPLVRKLYLFDDWTARQSMPQQERDALERWLVAGPTHCTEFFRVTVEGGRVISLEATFGVVAAQTPASGIPPRQADPAGSTQRRSESVEDRQLVSSGSPFEPSIGFSRAVRVGPRVLVSGTAPVWPDNSCDPDPYVQARRCIDIILGAIREAGGEAHHVVRTRMFITDASYGEAVGSAHGETFRAVRPAATMVVVAGLLDPRWKVEIEAEALLG